MPASVFIRAMHPKKEILPVEASIQRILNTGWVGQKKIHGHRCQIHISSDSQPLVAYTRQGRFHTKELSAPMEKEIRRLFTPKKGWNVLDAEWLKPKDKLYVFDLLKEESELLSKLTFPERWKRLPKDYLSPHVVTLPLIRTLPDCLKVLASKEEWIEGLVFKSCTTVGFSDTSIIRCRKRN